MLFDQFPTKMKQWVYIFCCCLGSDDICCLTGTTLNNQNQCEDILKIIKAIHFQILHFFSEVPVWVQGWVGSPQYLPHDRGNLFRRQCWTRLEHWHRSIGSTVYVHSWVKQICASTIKHIKYLSLRSSARFPIGRRMLLWPERLWWTESRWCLSSFFEDDILDERLVVSWYMVIFIFKQLDSPD